MQDWFTDAKFGIFIHWGIYAVGRRGGESWPMARAACSYDEYMQQMDGFDAVQYDPESWADLFKRSGARYAVLTTKHHDGVTLWPTRTGSPSIPESTGCGDLVEPYLAALRKVGLRTGLYFSHTDWSRLDHLSVLTGLSVDELKAKQSERWNLAEIWDRGKPLAGEADAERRQMWESFLEFHRKQIAELLGNYGDIDLIWFDVSLGQERFDYRFKKLREFIHSFSDKTVINSRMGGHGDYETPEQFIPVYPPDGPWELCITTNNTWSFSGKEEGYKTPRELLTMFCECLGMGGNLLLNVGPDEHGVIPAQQIELLNVMGDWIRRHEEAVYQTQRGLPHGYAYFFTSLNKQRDVIYLYIAHGGTTSTSVKGIHNPIKRISLLGSGLECSHKIVGGAPWMNVPGTVFIDIPQEGLEAEVSVLKIELDGPLKLYSGHGVEISEN